MLVLRSSGYRQQALQLAKRSTGHRKQHDWVLQITLTDDPGPTAEEAAAEALAYIRPLEQGTQEALLVVFCQQV